MGCISKFLKNPGSPNVTRMIGGVQSTIFHNQLKVKNVYLYIVLFQRLRHFPRNHVKPMILYAKDHRLQNNERSSTRKDRLVRRRVSILTKNLHPHPVVVWRFFFFFGGGFKLLPPHHQKKTMMCSWSVFCWVNTQTSCVSFVLVSSFKQIVGLHVMRKISWTSKSIRKGSRPRFYRSRCCFWKSSCANKWSTQKIIPFSTFHYTGWIKEAFTNGASDDSWIVKLTNSFWMEFIHRSFQQLLDWWDNDPSNGLSDSLQYMYIYIYIHITA